MDSEQCFGCGNKDVSIETISYGRLEHNKQFSCPICGTFEVSRHAEQFFDYSNPLLKRKFERFLYETREKPERLIVFNEPAEGRQHGLVITLKALEQLYQDDGSPLQKYEKTLRNVAGAAKQFGQEFTFAKDRWLVPTMDDDEALSIIQALNQADFIHGDIDYEDEPFQLTLDGLQYAAQLAAEAKSDSESVFIAACFSDELKEARMAIQNIISELGYTPRLVNLEAHNDIIDLKIFEFIRESRFIVADLTCNRQSVYYEIGFAHGLGLQVVLTCRLDHKDDNNNDFKRVHFDLNHRNILFWKNTEDLSDKLRGHIYQCFGSIA